MTTENPNSQEKPLKLADVLFEELKQTRPEAEIGERPADLPGVFAELHKHNLIALCFSGGGIRSATFGLGIVQALAKHGLLEKFDYLSTVSGGGYLGSWLSAWVHRASDDETVSDTDLKKEAELKVIPSDRGIHRVQGRINCIKNSKSANPEPPELRHLREYSNYMSPRTGLMSADTWTLIAIYLRNLFLNLTIFIPLLTAILILPRFLFQALIPPDITDKRTWAFVLLGGAMASGAVAIAMVVSRLPYIRAARKKKEETKKEKEKEKNKEPKPNGLQPVKPFLNSDAGVLIAGVLPIVLSAFLSAMLWAWDYRLKRAMAAEFDFGIELSVVFFLLLSVAAYAFGTVVYFIVNGKEGFHMGASIATLVTALVGGLLLWLVSQRIFDPETMKLLGSRIPEFEWQAYLILSVPLFLAIVLLAGSVFVGLSSRVMTDDDREWLARYGGWVMIVGCVWVVLNSLVLIGPSLISMAFRGVNIESAGFTSAILPTLISVAGVVSAVVSLIGGFSEKAQVRHEPVKTRTSKVLAIAPKIAAVVFLGFILLGLAGLGTVLLYALGLSSSLSHIRSLNEVGFSGLTVVFLSLAAIGIVMAWFVNVNKFSLHGAYRDRLVRAYLGASNPKRDQTSFTGFDDEDNLQLQELRGQRPLHIINATVNLVGGDNLAWQNRKAASFTMSALHCGSWAVGGYRSSAEYCVNPTSGKALRLGTAMAISGAAANPNMGYYSSAVVTFLMSLFNIRLGWWLGNSGKIGSRKDWFGLGKQRFFQKTSPSIAILPLINETFGRTDENKRFLMVTDGGHFENLALYEMVLRRCKLIVLSDGAADADFKFGEIANAIQKCKVDLGVDIKFVGAMNILGRYSTDEGEVKKSRFAVAKITYPEKDESGDEYVGWLLYTRPTYYGTTEPRDVRYYAESNEKFPHQSTGDQMYDEKQFEAYRGLGFMTMNEVIEECRLAKTMASLKKAAARMT